MEYTWSLLTLILMNMELSRKWMNFTDIDMMNIELLIMMIIDEHFIPIHSIVTTE